MIFTHFFISHTRIRKLECYQHARSKEFFSFTFWNNLSSKVYHNKPITQYAFKYKKILNNHACYININTVNLVNTQTFL